ncbi:hypothetical protein B0H17DRAFT_1205162 [Mycena rosella]|uniref:Uncharacterized protein n=1 Tax=Mycena rosella TaxID=1033263 RepID=A0AAD7GD36_MYCRO|nr:hypothetical protein B0H17DRAFT_1205162 [Mycena rosella]
MQSFATLTFDSAKILKTTLRAADDDERPLEYATTTASSGSGRQSTSLVGAQGSRDAVIDWKQKTFSVADSTRPIRELRKKRATFSSSRYWSWFDCEECKVKYQDNAWTVFSYSGSVLAVFTPNTHRGGRKALPVLRLASSVCDEEERRFIILVLLYSETKRQEGLRQRSGM